MEWMQYTTMDEMLAMKSDDWGSLSIVARVSSPDMSSVRVNLASMGIANSNATGHAAIVHEFEGHACVFFTSPDHPGRLGVSDRVPGEGPLVVRTKALKQGDVDELNSAMEAVSMRQDMGLSLWTPLRPSAAFASSIWTRTFGEELQVRSYGLSNPNKLADSIRAAADRELGITQKERPHIELSISERISDIVREQQAEEHTQCRGRKI